MNINISRDSRKETSPDKIPAHSPFFPKVTYLLTHYSLIGNKMTVKTRSEDIDRVREEIRKLRKLLTYVAIPVVLLAIVDIIDNIMGWLYT